jgi:hypothetical protein
MREQSKRLSTWSVETMTEKNFTLTLLDGAAGGN